MVVLALAFGAAFVPARALARPVEVSVVFSPGDMLDVLTRTLATEAEPLLGEQVLVLNKPGGGGMPGVAELVRVKPDGYSLVSAVSNALILLPHRNKAPYRPLKDVTPVISFGVAGPMLVVGKDSPWKSMEEFLQASRDAGGEVKVGVSGLGTPAHLALLSMSQADPALKWRFVPFAGAAEVETALLGGHVDAAASGDLSRVKSGQVLPLMVLAGQRATALPGTPSLVDMGYPDPGAGDTTLLLLAPAGISDESLRTLEQAFLKAAQSPVFHKAASGYSLSPVVRGSAETKAMLRQAWEKETGLLKSAGLIQSPATEPE